MEVNGKDIGNHLITKKINTPKNTSANLSTQYSNLQKRKMGDIKI